MCSPPTNGSHLEELDHTLASFSAATGVRLRFIPVGGVRTKETALAPFCALFHAAAPDSAPACSNFHANVRARSKHTRKAVAQTCSNGLTHLTAPVFNKQTFLGYLETEPLVREGMARTPTPVVCRKVGLTNGDSALVAAFSRILRTSSSQIDGLRMLIDLVATRIAATLPEEWTSNHPSKHSDGLVERTKRYINLHQTDAISTRNVALALKASEGHLCRVFRRATGKTISSWLADIRLARACELLRSRPVKRIIDIALEAGFQSESRFYSIFTTRFGVPPGAWRRKNPPRRA